MNKKSLGIMSIGPQSSRLVTGFAEELSSRRKNRYINRVIMYNYDNDNRLMQLKSLGLPYYRMVYKEYIEPNKVVSEIGDSLEEFQGVSHLMLFVDIETIKEVIEGLKPFYSRNAGIKILLLCYITGLDSAAIAANVQLITELRTERSNERANILPPILFDSNSSLLKDVPDYWELMIMRSVVFSLIETITTHQSHTSLFDQIGSIQTPAAGVSVISQGVSPVTIWGKLLFLIFRRFFCFLPTDLVLKKMLESVYTLLQAKPSSSSANTAVPIRGSIGKVDFQMLQRQNIIGLSFMVPYRKGREKYTKFIAKLKQEIHRNIFPNEVGYTSSRGEGVDSSAVDPHAEGNYHLQTMLIYPYIP